MGGFLIVLSFDVLWSRLSSLRFIALVVLSGLSGMAGALSFLSLYVIWQTIMLLALVASEDVIAMWHSR